MAIDERARLNLFEQLNQVLEPDNAETLIELLPPVGWADVATRTDVHQCRDTLRTEIRSVETRLDSKIDQLGTKLGSRITDLDTRLDSKIDQLGTTLGSRTTDLDTRLGSRIDQLGTTLGSRIAAVDGRITDLDTRLTGEIKELRTDLVGRITNLRTDLEGQIQRLESGHGARFDMLELKIDSLHAQLTAQFQEQTATLRTDLTATMRAQMLTMIGFAVAVLTTLLGTVLAGIWLR